MATFKAEVQNKRADGTYNVRVRITHNRMVRRISTNIFITDQDLTRSLKIKNTKVVEQCNDLIRKCREKCNEMGYEINALSADQFVEKLKRHLEGGERFSLDFIQYMKDKAAKMKESTGGTYLNAVSALVRFLGGDPLDIADINTNFLTSFEAFLEKEPSQCGNNRKSKSTGEMPKKSRAISAYIGSIRAIHNLAKKEYNDEDNGIIRIPNSPFKTFKIKPQQKTRKRALTIDKIQAIIDLPTDGSTRYTLAKDCFILSFALVGMNSIDMYNAAHLKKKILTYNRSKTADRRDDNAEMRILVEPCIELLLEKYKDKIRLFNFYKRYSTPKNFNRAINIGLKQIGDEIGVEDLEFYAARHSWATIARSAEIDKATVHEALNHVDNAMKITDIYIDKDWSLIWNANKKVLSFFDWSAIGYDLI